MNPFMVTGLMSGIVLLDALTIVRWAIALKQQARPYTAAWCYRYLRRGRRVLGYLRTSISVFSFQALFFLPQTFIGPNEIRHTSAWYGGTSILLALASYGLWQWLMWLLTVVSLSVFNRATTGKK